MSSNSAASDPHHLEAKWRTEPTISSRRRYRLSVLTAWIGVGLLTASLAWAATWLRPPKPAAFVLIGAGYEDNLSFSHNHYGWLGLQRLASLANESSSLSFWGEKLLELQQNPSHLRTDTRWDQGLDHIEQRAVVVVMAVHGGADPNGAYLLPQDAGTSPEGCNRLKVSAVLNRLAQLPANKQKVLILDASGLRVSWALGMLENAFVRELQALESKIASIPNCVVLCSSDHSQFSWVSEDYRNTVYLHFLGEGLRGAATDLNHDGRINAWELHQFTHNRVKNWVAHNRSAQQSPILLPAGSEGRQRASKIDLCIHRSGYQAPLPAEIQLPVQDLRELWQEYHSLQSASPNPAAYTPQLWRRYQLATIRCEELLRAGDVNNAARLRNLLRDITLDIQISREVKLSSLPNTLSMPYVAGAVPAGTIAGRDVLQKLWTAKPQKFASIWEVAKKSAPDSQLLQLSLYEQLVLRAAEDPASNLALACQLFEVVHDPLHCGPAETHLMTMLNRDLPAWSRQPAANEVVALALQVRLLAERAAAGVPEQGCAYSEQVFPWIETQISNADQQRRLGEDLLFSDASQQATAMNYLQTAREGYLQAQHAAERVQAAIAVRDQVESLLPFYSRWLAYHVSDNVIRLSDETLVSGLQSLWQDTHALAHLLQTPDPNFIAAAPPASQNRMAPRSLVNQTNIVRQKFHTMETRLQSRWEELTRVELAKVCADISSALQIPFEDIELRLKLQAHQQRVSRRFMMDKISISGAGDNNSYDAGPSNQSTIPVAQLMPASTDELMAGDPSDVPASMDMAPSDMSELSPYEVSLQSKSAGRWQGEIALAALGKVWFNACPGSDLETFEQVQHRLNVFNVEEDWWRSLLVAGAQIGYRWNAIPTTIQHQIDQSKRQPLEQAQQSIQQVAALSRMLCSGTPTMVNDNATNIYRCLQLQHLLIANTHRTYLEHWYALDPNAEPYYVSAGLVYLNDASRMSTHNECIEPLRTELNTPAKLVVDAPETLEITSEPRFQVRCEFRLPNTPVESLGFPVCWFETDPQLTLIQPEPNQRIFQHPSNADTPTSVTVVVDNPELLAAEADQANNLPLAHSSLTLHALYRGQKLTNKTRVLLDRTPEVVRVQLPAPADGNLAVRADAELQADYGSGSGALAIVLDCSGSMGPKTGDPFTPNTKFVEATTALKRVLSNLPAGTQVSVWIFGQAMGTGKTVPHAEDTIKQVQAPVIWNPHDAKQLDQLMDKVSYPTIQPWNESPIIRTMLAAKNDLMNVTGFKTLLVITDGMDNRFAEDLQTNPNKEDIPTALVSSFQDTGITVNVVGFKVVGGEQAEAKRQFSAVEKLFPPGRFYPVDQAAALASALDGAMEQRLRYWIENFQDQRLPMVPADGLDVGQSGAGDHWLPKGLPAGNFQVSALGQQPTRMPIAVDPGDLLLLRIGQENGNLNFQRILYSQTDYSWKPWCKQGDWRMSLLQNQRLPQDAVQMLVSLEQIPAKNETYLRLPKPQEVWLEVLPRDGGQSTSTRWGYTSAFPAPAYSVEISGWPQDLQENTLCRPLVNVWWSPDQPAPPAVSLARTRDFHALDELAGKQIQALTAQLTMDAVQVETHMVEVKPGVREPRSCLAVRMTLPADHAYWARPLGLEVAGAEHRYYQGSTKYTGLFWPVTQDEASKVLTGLSLVSLKEFKVEAERRGFTATMKTLPAPSPDDARPRAPLGSQ